MFLPFPPFRMRDQNVDAQRKARECLEVGSVVRLNWKCRFYRLSSK